MAAKLSLRAFPGQRSMGRFTTPCRRASASRPSRRFYLGDGSGCTMKCPLRWISYPSDRSFSISTIRLSSNNDFVGSILVEPSRERQCRLPSDFLSTLQHMHPTLSISRNPYDLDSHGHGESHHPISAPDAVVRPTSVEEIQDILRLCCRLRQRKEGGGAEDDMPTVEIVSVIPYGVGACTFSRLHFDCGNMSSTPLPT